MKQYFPYFPQSIYYINLNTAFIAKKYIKKTRLELLLHYVKLSIKYHVEPLS